MGFLPTDNSCCCSGRNTALHDAALRFAERHAGAKELFTAR